MRMRKRRNQRGIPVALASVLGSVIFNLMVGIPLYRLLEGVLSGTGSGRAVRVVHLSREQWARNRVPAPDSTRSKMRREAARLEARRAETSRDESRVDRAPPTEKKKEPEREERLKGQVVEVPPSADDSPNPDAKYLSKYNTHVDKESVARVEDRNPRMKRVTNKLQTTEQPVTPADAAVLTPNLSFKGDARDEKAESEVSAKEGRKQKFVLEIPDLQRRDPVRLKLGDGPGIGQRIENRTGSEALKGNASTFSLQLGAGGDDANADASTGKYGSPDGSDEKKSIPTLAALLPNLGAAARISGSPSRDHVEGVPEGDATFLNTKEFKYATFFYRVRDSVASYWEDLAANEYRRRDPTGNIYGIRDRSTLLRVQLNREGGLDDVRVEQTSGVEFLDHVAVEAFRKAEPFPNPPAGIADEDGNIRFNFQFVVTMRPRSPLNLFQYR